MPDIFDFLDDADLLEDIDRQELERRLFYLEATRPVDRLPPVGQQLADAWRAEHGDEPFPE